MSQIETNSFEMLEVSRLADHVMVVTLNRPEVRNAFNTQLGAELLDLWTSLYRDPSQCRVVVLTGAGDKAFCAGADLKERNGMSDDAWRQQHALFEQMIRAMMDCPVPIIGAINGAAYAGGLEIALNADFLYAVPSARFAFTEVTIGIMPGASGTQHLPRAVGVRRAKEVILAGKPFDANQALDWGLVNRICTPETLMEDALETAAAIAANAPIAIRQAKTAVGASQSTDIKTGYDVEIACYQRVIDTEDRLEGVAAFNEKRKPDFKGK
ncbi:MAG: enoyl-CoA hydratase/isomerase family protein [Rhodospirillales bacterium]|nr:enoyl-CoA hydratase/isomerase family protein [Rhodospirillales bacterium]MBO6788756.1 enoyl-CoA hydratase/isomerase family protein [Rhodospirillales bacterium]